MARILPALLALTASAGLAGCAYGDFGYGGVSIGVGSGGYYDDYYDAYGYGSYYGWYDGYYYPGAGYYIYDRGGNRHRWNDRHRRHWEGRSGGRDGRENWADYDRDGDRDGRRDRDWRGRGEGDRDRDGDWRGRRDGDRRADRDGRRNDAGMATPGTPDSPATGRTGAGWRDGGRDGGRDAGRGARGDDRGAYRPDNRVGRDQPAGRSPEVVRQVPDIAREVRAAPAESRGPAPEVRVDNREAARRIRSGED